MVQENNRNAANKKAGSAAIWLSSAVPGEEQSRRDQAAKRIVENRLDEIMADISNLTVDEKLLRRERNVVRRKIADLKQEMAKIYERIGKQHPEEFIFTDESLVERRLSDSGLRGRETTISGRRVNAVERSTSIKRAREMLIKDNYVNVAWDFASCQVVPHLQNWTSQKYQGVAQLHRKPLDTGRVRYVAPHKRDPSQDRRGSVPPPEHADSVPRRCLQKYVKGAREEKIWPRGHSVVQSEDSEDSEDSDASDDSKFEHMRARHGQRL